MAPVSVSVSESGDILSADGRFAELLAEPAAELLNEALHSYVVRHDRERLSAFLAVRDPELELEITLMRRDGSAAPVRVRLSAHTGDYAFLTVTAIAARS